MSVRFIPCPSCARHVKVGDFACPFCGAKAECIAPRPRAETAGLSRSALFAASALGVALGTSDCSSSTPSPGETGDAAQTDAPSAQPLYGAVIPPADGSQNDAPSAQPHYGAVVPPADASESDAPSAQPLYGAVSPPTDASDANRSDGPSVVPTDGAPSSDARDESPSVVALYGAFMPDAG